jgi:hypothetical protein
MRKSEHLLHTGHESTDVADSGGWFGVERMVN